MTQHTWEEIEIEIQDDEFQNWYDTIVRIRVKINSPSGGLFFRSNYE